MTSLSGRRLLVTGGTGMIGANLVHRLVERGCRPDILVRTDSSLLRLHGIEGQYHSLSGDLADEALLGRVLEESRPDIVFHFASTFFNPPTLSAATHLDVNVAGTHRLLGLLKSRPGVRFVFAGSAASYGTSPTQRETDPPMPATVFGATKAMGTLLGQTYARLHGLSFVELRLFSPFGPWERPSRLIPYTILNALIGKDVDIGDGRQERDFVYIDDVIEAILLAATADVEPGSVFNLGAGRGRPIQEVVETILALMGNPVSLRCGARETRRDEIWKASADIGAIRRALGWEPRTSFEDGLRRTIAWYRDHREIAAQLT